MNTAPIGFNGAIQEGKAAKLLGLPPAMNPYRKEALRLLAIGKEPDSRLCELESDWDSGWTRGVKLS